MFALANREERSVRVYVKSLRCKDLTIISYFTVRLVLGLIHWLIV